MAKERPDHFNTWRQTRKQLLEQGEPTVTDVQFDIWIDHPVTFAFLKALTFRREDEKEAAGGGNLVDSSNADLTHALTHRALGRQDAYEAACDPWAMLIRYKLVQLPEEEVEDE